MDGERTSLLLSPFILFASGLVVARISKSKRVWRRHGLFTRRASALVFVLYFLVTISLLLDLDWVQPMVAYLPAESGTDWVVNGGVLHLDGTWPIEDKGTFGFVLLGFVLTPLWLWLGVLNGYLLFGRSPKQTGILGLLR